MSIQPPTTHIVVDDELLRRAGSRLLQVAGHILRCDVSAAELLLMRAQTAEECGEARHWFHLPIGLTLFSLVSFVRQYLRSGRLWLAWLVAGMPVVPFALSAQTGLPFAEPGFAVTSWDSGGSVPGKFTTAMARTPDGYLWLGTRVGLLRFDGVRFVTLTTNTTPTLGDNRISSLLVDRDGVLWIGTQGGTLSRRLAGSFLPVPLDLRLRGIPIESLAAGDKGEIWLVTEKQGLVRVASGICDFSNSTTNLTQRAARSMVRLANGEWWAMAQPGPITFQRGTWKTERFGLKPGTWFWALAPDRQGVGLWLATAAGTRPQSGARVLKIEGGKVVRELAPYPWRQDSRYNRITSIIEDSQGRVWAGMELGGAFCWQSEMGWRELKSREGLSYIQIREFFADSEGLLWMATRDEMLHRITERLVATVELPPEHAKDLVVSACITRDGTLWAGTEDSGVFRFRENRFWQVTNGLHSLNVGTMCEDSRSNLWVGTQRGLLRWSGDKFYPVSVGTPARAVYALCEDGHGNMWAGNGLQVVRLRPDGQARVYGRESGLGESLVLGLAEDTQGRIYASQEKAGLFRLNGERFDRVAGFGPGFGADGYLLPDEEGSLWVATQSKGLHRLHQGEFQSWSFADGLPNDYLRSVMPDGAGNLWFSASKGIFGCARIALLDYQRGKTPPILFWRLGEVDGMNGAWTSGFGQPVAARSADGRIWFPNRNVVAVIEPKVVTRPRFNPPPSTEEVNADGIALSQEPNGTLQIRSGARRVEFHYTCPDLESPEILRFRYCLEGFDDQWIEAGSRRVAYYGQLEPGDYRFRVMVGGHTGKWTECEAPLALSVLPRWWEITSVRILGFLSVLGLLVGTTWRVGWSRHRRKIEQLELQLARKRSEAELQTLRGELVHVQRVSTMGHFSTALAHELNQPLGAILSNAEAAEMFLDAEPPALDKVREILADIRKDDERAGEVIRRMRALLQKRELARQRLDVNELVQSVLELVKADASRRGTSIRPELAQVPLPTRGDSVHLQQVLLNLLVNGMEAAASLPSPSRRLTVRTGRNTAGEIEVAVSDNGPGIPADLLSRLFEPFFTTKPHGMGMGISIARTIIRAHHGRIWVENNPGGGAVFRFTLPVDEGQRNPQDSTERARDEGTNENA